ncbi:hypothetical protein FJZ18_03090 [Candidatus Pacearchaeota archaeon]|nr:hypothetical protein [Candidatus Pacearchaeota archaeon]
MVEPTLTDLIRDIGQIGLWLQTLGVIVVLWIVFEVYAFLVRRKRMKEIYAIKEDMKRIEKKVDKILKNHS